MSLEYYSKWTVSASVITIFAEITLTLNNFIFKYKNLQIKGYVMEPICAHSYAVISYIWTTMK